MSTAELNAMSSGLAGRLLRWLVHRVGRLTLLRFLLSALFLLVFTIGLSGVVALPVLPLALAGWLAQAFGWQLARSRRPGWEAGLLAVSGGALGLLVALGGLFRPLLALLACRVLDLALLEQAWEGVRSSLEVLALRFGLWLQGCFSGQAIEDPLVTALLWALAAWCLACWSAWWLRRRRNALVAFLPFLALLAPLEYFSASQAGLTWLVLAAGIWLLVFALEGYLRSDQAWLERRLERVSIETSLAIAVLLLAAGMVLAARLLPEVPYREIARSVEDWFEGMWEGSPASGQEVAGGRPVSGIDINATIHTVGAGPVPSAQVLYTISIVDHALPVLPGGIPPSLEVQPAAGYRWRVQTYDRYTGRSWSTFTEPALLLEANAYLDPGGSILPDVDRLVVAQVRRVGLQEEAVPAAGELLRLDQPYTVLLRPGGELAQARTAADSYTVESRLAVASVEQLRQAGTDYPPAVLAGYLDLPEDLPQRVRNLALQLTAGQSTAFDKAAVLEAYLRQYPYTLDVPAPPSGREVADYFLFTLKQGYCDYFATTMVVMARAAGLPSRLVLGYSTGSYDPEGGFYLVRAQNAHAWVDVYFPGIGWVEFEPTSGQLAIQRPGGEGAVAAPPVPEPDLRPAWQLPLPRLEGASTLLPWLAAALGLALLLILLPWEAWRLRLLPSGEAVDRIYHRLYRLGRRFHPAAGRALTPHEFAAALLGTLENSTRLRKHPGSLEQARRYLAFLTDVYTRLHYGPRGLAREEQLQAVRAWSHLRRSLRHLR